MDRISFDNGKDGEIRASLKAYRELGNALFNALHIVFREKRINPHALENLRGLFQGAAHEKLKSINSLRNDPSKTPIIAAVISCLGFYKNFDYEDAGNAELMSSYHIQLEKVSGVCVGFN